jgi:hypothetical protein
MFSVAFFASQVGYHVELKMLHLVLLHRLPLLLNIQLILLLLNIYRYLLNPFWLILLLQVSHYIILTAPHVLQQALPCLPHSLDRGTSLLLRPDDSFLMV